jgi:hypothetical protein
MGIFQQCTINSLRKRNEELEERLLRTQSLNHLLCKKSLENGRVIDRQGNRIHRQRFAGRELALKLADALADKAQIAALLEHVNAENARLRKALEVLLEEAEGFNVLGVYFDEQCMGHRGPDMARAALNEAQ